MTPPTGMSPGTSASILPTPSEIVAWLDRAVIGQDRAKRALAVATYGHYLGQAARAEYGSVSNPFGKRHTLLLGPTGTGKSYLVMLLAQRLGVPFSFTNAKSLVEAGYVGHQVDSILRNLYLRAGSDVKKAQRGIVFIDEIDKLRADFSGDRDVSGEGVQNSLLTMLDGRPIAVNLGNHETVEIDTSGILFIGAGAFGGLPAIVRRRIAGPVALGFGAPLGERARREAELFAQVQPADLEEFGFIPEFVGRFRVIAATHELSCENLVDILGHAEDSVIAQQARMFDIHGVTLSFDEHSLREIARQAEEEGTGARGLDRCVKRLLQDLESRLPDLAAEGVRRVLVTREVVRGEGPAILERGGGAAEPSEAEVLRRRAFEILGLEGPAPRERGSGGTLGWSIQRFHLRIALLRDEIGWTKDGDAASRWWSEFERRNLGRPELVLRLAEELLRRKATVQDLHRAYLEAGTESLQAVVHYLDYLRARDRATDEGAGPLPGPETGETDGSEEDDEDDEVDEEDEEDGEDDGRVPF